MMIKKKFIKVIPIVCIALNSYGTPTIYPKNFNLLGQVNNPTDSNLVADDYSSNTIYVLPPNVATAKMSNAHSLTTNLGFCKEMGNIQQYSQGLSLEIRKLSIKNEEDQKKEDELQLRLNKAQSELSSFIALKNLNIISEFDDKISTMEMRLQEIYTQLQNCTNACELINEEGINLEKEKRELVKIRRQEMLKNAQLTREYEKRRVVVTNLSSEIEQIKNKNIEARKQILAIRKDFNEMYSQFGKMEGLRVNMLYTSQWDHNLQKLKDENLNFDFKKIPTSNAKIYASLKDLPTLPQDSAIISFEIPGTKNENYISINAGFPDSLESNVVLSLIGACPMVHPEYFDLPKNFDTHNVDYGLIISYDFPTSVNINVTAKYNMYKIYQKIVNSGSSGGFFSSRSWTKIEEKNFFRDVLKIEWNSQDDSLNLSDEKREALESDMRKHILERLATLALPSAPNKNELLTPSLQQQHGAVILSNSLVKSCPGNLYCLGGSIVLNVLDSIFGKGSATASYMQTQDFEITEVWSNSKVVMKPWVTSYINEK